MVLPINVPCHAEIGNFHHPADAARCQETITRCDIAMDEPILFQISASLADVEGHLQQVDHAQSSWSSLKNEAANSELRS
jgi:hypothetical protein